MMKCVSVTKKSSLPTSELSAGGGKWAARLALPAMMTMMMMIPTRRIMFNIEMFLPHSISNRSTQVLEGGMDTHLRKDWIFVFLWLDFFFYLPAIVSVFWSGWYSLKQYSVWIELKVLYWVITIQIASPKRRHRNFFKLYANVRKFNHSISF